MQGEATSEEAMNRRRIVGVVLLILAVILAAIFLTGGISIPSVMEIYNCSEMFSRFDVDADQARQAVPSDVSLKLNHNGEALMLVMVQECERMVLDHVIDVGAVGMSHIWIEIEGPDEYVETLPGTTRSLATRYWHILPHQLDNRLARFLFGLVGVDAEYVQDISLGGEPIDIRSGEVLEASSPESRFSWTESIQLYPEEDIVTGSQRFFRRYGLRYSEAVAKCESHFLGDSQVNLVASASSMIGQLGFGATIDGIANPVFVEYFHVN
jgi:hypothetical protein